MESTNFVKSSDMSRDLFSQLSLSFAGKLYETDSNDKDIWGHGWLKQSVKSTTMQCTYSFATSQLTRNLDRESYETSFR